MAPGGRPAGAGGMGGLLDGSTPTPSWSALLEPDADRYTWVAAAIGSNQAAGYQLATGEPVMAIGGFNGSDPSPTLAAVPGARRRRQDPLLPRRRAAWAAAMGGSDTSRRDQRLGDGQLHRQDGRRRDRLRPHRRLMLTTSPGAWPSAAGSPTSRP